MEIANVHAIFMHIAENKKGCSWKRGEYPTLSAIFIRQSHKSGG